VLGRPKNLSQKQVKQRLAGGNTKNLKTLTRLIYTPFLVNLTIRLTKN
jgi:hypothetical protein